MVKAIELLERTLGFMNFIKHDEGEGVDPENLEKEISDYLEEIKQYITKSRDVDHEGNSDLPFLW